jgi:ABC-type phosphate/phosphonate transport system substrate-binding protein
MNRTMGHGGRAKAGCGAGCSRRSALSLLLGAGSWLPAMRAAGTETPLRLAISESVVGEVNLNDARPAMQVWIRRMGQEVNVAIDPKVFNTTQEIQERTRLAQLDAAGISVLEYRPIADLLDSSQLITSGGAAGLDQYVILVHRKGSIRQLAQLKGRRLSIVKNPKMVLAPAWLATLLEEGHHPPAEQFFGSMVVNAKFSQVILPVFFGQADACLTTRPGFDAMCEMNPQVGRDLIPIASSPAMVVNFYVFRKNYRSASREKFIRALLDLQTTPMGAQLAAFFQFNELTVRDGVCLAPALAVIEAAERARGRLGAGGRK